MGTIPISFMEWIDRKKTSMQKFRSLYPLALLSGWHDHGARRWESGGSADLITLTTPSAEPLAVLRARRVTTFSEKL
jgi:hypothetical protein